MEPSLCHAPSRGKGRVCVGEEVCQPLTTGRRRDASLSSMWPKEEEKVKNCKQASEAKSNVQSLARGRKFTRGDEERPCAVTLLPSCIQQTLTRDVLILAAVLDVAIEDASWPLPSQNLQTMRENIIEQAVMPPRVGVIVGKVCMYRNTVILALFLPFPLSHRSADKTGLPQASRQVEATWCRL